MSSQANNFIRRKEASNIGTNIIESFPTLTESPKYNYNTASNNIYKNTGHRNADAGGHALKAQNRKIYDPKFSVTSITDY